MMKRFTTWSVLVGIAWGASLALGADKVKVDPSKLPPPASKAGITYASDVKVILDQSCAKCHGAEKPKAKLRLDSLEGALKGGEDGKVIKPGDSAGSLMVHAVSHVGDPDGYMPPPKNKAGIGPLSKDQIGLIRAWIDQGAK
jgi:mono/diheme cytochrome c family protein